MRHLIHTAAPASPLPQAIFADEYRLISSAPPRFAVHLRDPGTSDTCDDDACQGPPSRLFRLKFTLPPGYPSSASPLVEVEGPLAAKDPRREALAGVLAAAAAEALDVGISCAFQLVEAAKDWIDGNLPADIGERRPDGTSTAAAVRHDSAAPADETGELRGMLLLLGKTD